MAAPSQTDLELTSPQSAPPRLTWHLATNQLNLLFMLAAGLVTGPQGLGRKYYQDPLSLAPGWIPLFADRIPAKAFEQSVSEANHLRPLAAALDLTPLKGPVKTLGTDGHWQDRRFPDELDGSESALLVPSPLPTTWIQAIVFASKKEQALIHEQADDYANVPLKRYKQKTNKTLLAGNSTVDWPPPADPPPERDASPHWFAAIGSTQALLFGLANRGDGLVEAARLLSDPFAVPPEAVSTPPAEGAVALDERVRCFRWRRGPDTDGAGTAAGHCRRGE